jgi:OOP family OmpA-OmpF porin
MKKSILKKAFLYTLTILFATCIWAQDMQKSNLLFNGNSGFRKWSLGVHLGGLAPMSALGGKNDFSGWNMTFGYGANVKYQATHTLGLQLDFLRGNLEGNNSKQWANQNPSAPYASFSTELNWATSLSGQVNLGNINWSFTQTDFQPYIMLGVGAVNFNPTVVNNAGVSSSFKAGGGSSTEMYIPVGIGFKANLSPTVNLDMGYTMAYMDADNLDGYYKEPYIGDKFSYLHVGLEFILGNKNKPQLAKHNPAAQLNNDLKRDQETLKSLIALSEERNTQKLAELDALKEQANKMKMDKDGDGVADYFDKCPGTPRTIKVDGAGCPLNLPVKDTVVHNTYITNEDRRIVSEAINNLEFQFGKSAIAESSLPYLDKVASMMVDKGFSLKLGGHTDNIGSEEANMKLSKDRAEAIKNYLVSQGVNNGKVEAVGYGESQPIATNKTAAGRQKNRRVEFTLY